MWTRLKYSPLLILVVLTLINLCNYADRYLLAGVLTPIKTDMGFTDASLGRIGTAFMIGYIITSPLFGWLGDRFSRGSVILTGLVFWNAGVWMTSRATSIEMFILWRAVVGVGEAAYVAGAPSLLADYFTGRGRNFAMTVFYAAIPVGSAIGFTAGAAFAARVGWRHAFEISGAVGSVIVCFCLIFRGSLKAQGSSAESSSPLNPRDYQTLVSNGRYVFLVLGYAAYAFVLNGYGFWGPVFFQRRFGISPEDASSFFGVALACSGLLGTIIGGFAGSRLRARYVSGYSILLTASILSAIPCTLVLLQTSDLMVAKASLILCMLFLFLGTGPVTTLIIDVVEERIRTGALALSTFLSYVLGSLWAAEVIGKLTDQHGGDLRHAMILLMPPALLLAGVCWGTVMFLEIRRRYAATPV